ncbi:hypothetical protein AVEN_202686-1 [Araneus ventricosus]|uniref:DUF4817 domain-containing protein n=1 Tax=Araneus ventricosus TaxID=182803 RepID=A0A4Y2WQT7_ARAVE|nr:hypothetical protein AVEN_202686-1 [Araneus ventricosus]
MYYANEDGTSYLSTRDYYKKDVSAGLYVQSEVYDKMWHEGVLQYVFNLPLMWAETGDVTSRPRVRKPRNVGRKVKPEDVLAYSHAHPRSSTKMISENCGLSKSLVFKILNESGDHRYRSTPVHGLLQREFTRGATL